MATFVDTLDILNALSAGDNEQTPLPKELEDLIGNIAKDGELRFEWSLIRRLLRRKICSVLDHYFRTAGFTGPLTETYESRKEEVLHLLDSYEDEAPFTTQRLAEILVHCSNQYEKTHKLINGIVKCLSVSNV